MSSTSVTVKKKVSRIRCYPRKGIPAMHFLKKEDNNSLVVCNTNVCERKQTYLNYKGDILNDSGTDKKGQFVSSLKKERADY